MYFLFASFGNDSIALVQWAHENELEDLHVVYSNTGWASEDWPARVEAGAALCEFYGFQFRELSSEGMENLVKRKKGWPMPASNMQFCTGELKVNPSLAFMDELDPNKEWVCLVGVRREESENRSSFPEYVEESEKHGGRTLYAPLVRVLESERNELIERAGFDVLPYRSRECFPCINANRDTLRDLPESRVIQIEGIELSIGFTKNGKPRTMYRPYRHMKATGIRQVVEWAKSDRGKYIPPPMCTSGYCGS